MVKFTGVLLAAMCAVTLGAENSLRSSVEALVEGHKKCRYRCPAYSEPRPYAKCRRSFDDCVCQKGFKRTAKGCVPHAYYDLETPAVAYCALTDNKGTPSGYVKFTEVDEDHVLVEGQATNLEPGLHGWHIHAVGDLTNPDGRCINTGGHYNPSGVTHGKHSGDLGNIQASEDGVAYISQLEDRFSVREIYGRAIIVHGGEDDLGQGEPVESSQANGNAGPRVLCCVIGRTDVPSA